MVFEREQLQKVGTDNLFLFGAEVSWAGVPSGPASNNLVAFHDVDKTYLEIIICRAFQSIPFFQ